MLLHARTPIEFALCHRLIRDCSITYGAGKHSLQSTRLSVAKVVSMHEQQQQSRGIDADSQDVGMKKKDLPVVKQMDIPGQAIFHPQMGVFIGKQ